MANLEHQRAEYAWQCAQEGLAKADSDYKNLCKGAPALVMNNGLMQTLAFYQDKGKGQHQALNRHLMKWLHQRYPQQISVDQFNQVMQSLYQSDSSFYREATSETLALLRWLRQFSSV